jgi:hypothetical protein
MLIPGEQWRTHRSPDGYSVDIPIAPSKDLQALGMKPDPNLRAEGGILWNRGECYVVLHGDIPGRGARAESDDQMLKEAVRGMAADPEVRRVARDVPVVVSGFPGREVEFEGTDGGSYLARVVIADQRVFVVIGGGRFVRPGNANIRRFVESFQVTDPNLKPVGAAW